MDDKFRSQKGTKNKSRTKNGARNENKHKRGVITSFVARAGATIAHGIVARTFYYMIIPASSIGDGHNTNTQLLMYACDRLSR